MKKLLPFILILLTISACKEDKKEDKIEEMPVIHDAVVIPEETRKTAVYPAPVKAVFNAHGSLARWNRMKNLCFEMKGASGTETHTISLPDRRSKIETKDWSIGYNGRDVWLLEHTPGSYKGDARFYHNLMFYFYAMPFVLGDDGINYLQLEPVELDGRTYGAIKVSYEDGIGDTPEDEYTLYYDQDTNKMVWLGYTVTYQSGEKSDDWHYIKYDSWEEINGLLLPVKLTWYNVKDGKPAGERNDIRFNKILVTETTLENSTFEKPDAAVIVNR